MKGNYPGSLSALMLPPVRDHPQMKGNCTLQAPALAVLTGLLQAALEKLLPPTTDWATYWRDGHTTNLSTCIGDKPALSDAQHAALQAGAGLEA